MIEDNIYNYLISLSAITDLVDPDCIGFVDVEESTTYPQIVFNCISDPQLYQTNDKWQRWRFFIFAKDKFVLREIKSELCTALNGLYDLMDTKYIDYITKLDDTLIVLRDDKIYETYVDFRILYH